MNQCSECNEYINFYSEGETYDYTEDDEGNIVYLCENCLNALRSRLESE